MSPLSLTSSVVAICVALTLSVVTAYPTKDEEYYYNRLHELPDAYNKDVRNLDGIDARENSQPIFALLAKADQDSEKGSQTKYNFGSGSHLDGIGGGHLVREPGTEQGLLDVMQGNGVYLGTSETFGSIRKFPEQPTDSGIENVKDSFEILKSLYGPLESSFVSPDCSTKGCRSTGQKQTNQQNSHLGVSSTQMKPFHKNFNFLSNEMETLKSRMSESKRGLDSLGGGHLLRSLNTEPLQYTRHMDVLGGGHLLSKKDLDSLGGGHLLRGLDENPSLYSRHINPSLYSKKRVDSLGGSHLITSLKPSLYSKHLNLQNGLNTNKEYNSLNADHLKRELDSLGGGHLIRELDSLGGGHLIRGLDSLGGGHLLREVDSLGGGHLIRGLDSLGEGHLLREVDQLGGGHLIRGLDSLGGGHLLREVDQLGGGHLIRGLDSLGGGHLLREVDQLGGGHLIRGLDSLGGGHLLREVDQLGGGHLIRGLDSLGSGHLLREVDQLGGGHLIRGLDSLGGGHLLREIDQLGGGHLIRGLDSLGGGHLLREVDQLGGGHLITDPSSFSISSLKKSRKVDKSDTLRNTCSSFNKLYDFIKIYLQNVSKTPKIQMPSIVDNEVSNEKNGNEKTHKPKPSLSSKQTVSQVDEGEIKPESEQKTELTDSEAKGLVKDEVEEKDYSEVSELDAPFSGVIELNKIYIPYYFSNNAKHSVSK